MNICTTSALWAIIGADILKLLKLISCKIDPLVTAIQFPPELKASFWQPATISSLIRWKRSMSTENN